LNADAGSDKDQAGEGHRGEPGEAIASKKPSRKTV
jgi:hypothetical protein